MLKCNKTIWLTKSMNNRDNYHANHNTE
uniref:Uncharacterized protein n=1 Tax=Anguilla anguilla TaxID=7936 RepID=A0A0E9SZ46_ANGAN